MKSSYEWPIFLGMAIPTARQLLEIAQLRKGMRIDDVARAAGVTYWQAYSFLRGRGSKNQRVAKAICDALGIDPALLVDYVAPDRGRDSGRPDPT